MSNISLEISTMSNTCANCGKEGSDVTNTCNKCKSVKYCNAACKKKHRKKHKKECERLVAELHDEKLFKESPPDEECPICMIQLPTLESGRTYMSCCGKVICRGCTHAPVYDDKGNEVENKSCPFCRTPSPTSDEEMIKRYEKRVELNDANAIYSMGCCYAGGQHGLPQNHARAVELWLEAGELEYPAANCNVGYAYSTGEGVEMNMEKALYYWELAAMGGYSIARHNLGIVDGRKGNIDRAIKHFMIAVKDGNANALKKVKQMYKIECASKDDYTTALRLYQSYLDGIKSDQRDEAAAYSDEYKYY